MADATEKDTEACMAMLYVLLKRHGGRLVAKQEELPEQPFSSIRWRLREDGCLEIELSPFGGHA